MKLILAVRIADTTPRNATRVEDNEANTPLVPFDTTSPGFVIAARPAGGIFNQRRRDYREGTIPWHAKQHRACWGFCSFCPAQVGLLPNPPRRK